MNITTSKICDVNITTNRNRVKKYGLNVYLKDGQKFELEMYNPHTYKVLAKIKLNGYYISTNGLILNPGQRVFLERFLDRDESFIFSTYEVDDDQTSKEAIAYNGDVEVEFFAQTQFTGLSGNWWNQNTYTYFNNPTTNNALYSSTVSTNTLSFSDATFTSATTKSIETGRVEGGEATGQEFTFSNDSFSSWAFETRKIKIKPVSAKPIEVSEIRNYCTNCGTRAKKATWKFCPNCGNKI